MQQATTVPSSAADAPEVLSAKTRQFYLDAMGVLEEAGIEYLVGGAYSLAHHCGIVRHTKDFDVFVRKDDSQRALDVFQRADYLTELVFPHWLGKAFEPRSEDFVDVIFSSGNGLCDVDETWFAHAVQGSALGRPAKLVPAEEIIWTKAFIQERERFDGADIAHLLLARGRELDWPRLVSHFQGHEQVLLSHLIMFTYIYPGHRDNAPADVIDRLYQAARAQKGIDPKLCRGTTVSRQQYLPDLRDNGFLDSRLPPFGRMKAEDVAHWTAAIGTIR